MSYFRLYYRAIDKHKSRQVNQWNSTEGLGTRSVELQPAAALTNIPETDDKMPVSSAEEAMKLDSYISHSTKARSKQIKGFPIKPEDLTWLWANRGNTSIYKHRQGFCAKDPIRSGNSCNWQVGLSEIYTASTQQEGTQKRGMSLQNGRKYFATMYLVGS